VFNSSTAESENDWFPFPVAGSLNFCYHAPIDENVVEVAMKKSFVSSLILIILLLCTLGAPVLAASETYAIDPVHSTVCFKVGHANFGFIRGRFNDFSGTILRDRDDPSKGSVDLLIKTDSIDTAIAARDGHLKGPDFFDTKSFPTMGFKSSSVEKLTSTMYAITGDFTLHGVTKRIRVKVKFIGEGKDMTGAYRAGAETEFTIKRSEYGMAKLIPGAGDAVEITVILEGVRK
jgi:polyisoprenoid-binding protein YceI